MAAERIALNDGLAAAVTMAAAVFAADGVVVFPTETVYGIGVAVGQTEALAALRRLKSRDAAKPFQFLVADVAMAEAMGAVFSGGARRLAERFWPGPMTLVVPNRFGGEALGIRIPDAAFMLAVCRRLGGAVVSSSANQAGLPPPRDADAADAFGAEVDLLVDGGPVTGGTPSTVVRCRDDGYEILRQGGVDAGALAEAWG